MNKSEELREYFREMGESTVAAAAKALGRSTQATRSTAQDLISKGWLKKIPGTNGIYEYVELLESDCGRAATLQQTIWRAIRISKTFTVWDIAMYSGATLDYTKKYVMFLKRKEIVKKVGKKGQKAVYRCIEDVPRSTPIMKRSKVKDELHAQELKAKGWELMRAIRDGGMEEVRRVYGEMGQLVKSEE